jgi:hypothetical protein
MQQFIGKIFITQSGYDPEYGRHVNDPFLGPTPTLGACRPDIRRKLKKGDHIFTISGRVPGVAQFVMGGFEIAAKIPAGEAYKQFPNLRLHQLDDGQVSGNIIVNSRGEQHALDNHSSFHKRIENYVIGTNLVAARSAREIEVARKETLEVLQEIIRKKGKSAFELVGRFGADLSELQVIQLRQWLADIPKRCA